MISLAIAELEQSDRPHSHNGETKQTATEPLHQVMTLALPVLAEANSSFVADREIICRYNKNNLAELVRLFVTEVREFNGGDHEGYFSHPENYADYCQQEVSDIIIFGLQLFDFLTERELLEGRPTIEDFEADILASARTMASELQVLPVDPRTQMHKPQNLEGFKSKVEYDGVRSQMTKRAEHISLQQDQPEQMYKTLVYVLACTYVLQWMLQLDPVRAGMEKVARNIVLYSAKDWALSEEVRERVDNLSPQRKEQYIKSLYQKRRAEAKLVFSTEDFYGSES